MTDTDAAWPLRWLDGAVVAGRDDADADAAAGALADDSGRTESPVTVDSASDAARCDASPAAAPLPASPPCRSAELAELSTPDASTTRAALPAGEYGALTEDGATLDFIDGAVTADSNSLDAGVSRGELMYGMSSF